MQTEAGRRAKRKYRAKTKRYYIELYPKENELIEKLENERKKGGYMPYIKTLIKEDIKKGNN